MVINDLQNHSKSIKELFQNKILTQKKVMDEMRGHYESGQSTIKAKEQELAKLLD